jgi:hypothetical protein
MREKLDYFKAIADRGQAANGGDAPATAKVIPIGVKDWLPSIDEVDLDSSLETNTPVPDAPEGDNTGDSQEDARAALGGASRQGAKQGALEELNALASQYTAFHAQTGETLVIVKDGRGDVVPIMSEAFMRRLKVDMLNHTGKSPAKAHLELVRDLVIERAEHVFRQVHKRIAQDKDDVIVDLGDEAGRRLRVTALGWQVEPGGEDILFRRGKGYGVIEVPDVASDAREAWQWLEPLLERVPTLSRIRLVSWLIASALCEADYPIVLLVGPEGSAKTALAQSIASVLDPPQGLLPTISADSAKDIIAGVQRRHVCVLDNAPKKLGGDIEDTLCRISTGAQFEERMLYTNFDVASAELHAPLIVTAITHPFRQRDTRNRTIVAEIDAIQSGFKRRSDAADEINQALGKIRGAVLFFLSAYLRQRDAILAAEVIPHRMVDWAVAGEAIGRELGQAPGKFFAQVERVQRRDAGEYLEGDAVGSALLRVLKHWGDQAVQSAALPPLSRWKGQGWTAIQNVPGELTIAATPTAIQRELVVRARTKSLSPSDDNLPNSARATTGAIKRLQGILGRAGVQTKLLPQGGTPRWLFQCSAKSLNSAQ